ncbi:MAG TPA: M10 family metallopeptidase C-terminal domain-containing protein [Xenococcaceae cyanobacterium]
MSNSVASVNNIPLIDFVYIEDLLPNNLWQLANDNQKTDSFISSVEDDQEFSQSNINSSVDENSILSANFGWVETPNQEIHSSLNFLACSCPSCCGSSASNSEFTNTSNNLDSNSPQSAPFATGDYRLDALIGSYPWPGNTITYSFFDGGNYYGTETAWEVSNTVKNNVRYIIENYIEPLIDVDFVEVSDAGNSYGTIRYMLSDAPNYAYAYLPSNSAVGGDVHLNPNQDNASTTNGFQGGFGTHGFTTLIHETLHALGLKHPGNYDAGSGTAPGPFLPYGEDNLTNTVMSYNLAGNSPSSMMPYDTLALQYLYGASNYNAGNTTYTFDTVFGFSDGTQYWGSPSNSTKTKVSIWDSGGIDLLDFSQLSNSSSGYLLDLNEGGILTTGNAYNGTLYQAISDPSSTNYSTTTYGTALGYGMKIENAVGSSSNDGIIGNNVKNTLYGMSGNDILYGENGNDTLLGGEGNDRLNGGKGKDSLEGSSGNDRLNGGSGQDSLFGGADRDTLTGGAGNDLLLGEGDRDILRGNKGNDVLAGGGGNDVLFGNQGSDAFVLEFGQGKDTIRDFTDGVDFFFVSNGMSFEDLSINNNNQGTAAIIRDDANTAIAVVKNVDAALITELDFLEI